MESFCVKSITFRKLPQLKFEILLIYINSDESQNIKCHRYIYLLSNPLFLEAGQNDKFHLRFGAKLLKGKNYFRKLAALLLFLHRDC